MESLYNCAICGKKMHDYEIHLCGGVPTLIHSCVNDIEMRIRADTKQDVARKWNSFVTITNMQWRYSR